ncbi:MAG: PorT family protein [Bacteroidota bacterium]|nr:MAG: PorT family protein [Bacteroidota bacterium]
MKTKIRFVFPLLVLLLPSVVSAQYLWLKGGVNSSNMTVKDNQSTYSTDYLNRIGFNAGLTGGMRFGFIGFEGGLLLSSKGYNFDNTDINGNKVAGNTSLLYLDVPVLLKLSAGLGSMRVYAATGPVLAFGLSGTNTTETTLSGQDPVQVEEKIKWGSSADDDIKSSGVDYTVGAGIELSKLSLGVSYNWSLSNLAPTTDNGQEIKHSLWQFTLGFKIFGD